MRRRLLLQASVGAAAGGALALLPVESALGLPLVERLVALGPLVVAPLALEAALRGPAAPSRLERATAGLQLPAALLAAAALLVPIGPASAALAAPWAAVAALFTLVGLLRLAPRSRLALEEVTLDAGLVYAGVGGAWLLLSRAGLDTGFGPAITALTAAHFHFAGLGAGAATGQLGRLVRAPEGRAGEGAPRRPEAGETPPPGEDALGRGATTGPPEARPERGARSLAYEVGATSVALTPLLVALGITIAPLVEVVAALLLAGGVLLVALSACALVPRRPRPATAVLALAQLVSLVTMALACAYAWGEWTGEPLVGIEAMARSHGLLNALGYTIPSLLVLARLAPRATEDERSLPIARVPGRGFVGADWFDRRGLVDPGQAPKAITRSIDALAGGPISRDVARYYEEDGLALVCRPRWQPGFRLLGRLAHALGRRMGQAVLPLARCTVGVRLAGLDPAKVGLPGVVASIRTYEDGAAMYVCAYSEHVAPGPGGRPCMDIALPLPLGLLQSSLRGRPLPPDGGLVLSSVPEAPPWHTGIWWCVGPLRLRLPLDETLEARPATQPLCMVAVHRFRLLGLPVLELDYVVGPSGGAWAEAALR